jgi:hypothetical protein
VIVYLLIDALCVLWCRDADGFAAYAAHPAVQRLLLGPLVPRSQASALKAQCVAILGHCGALLPYDGDTENRCEDLIREVTRRCEALEDQVGVSLKTTSLGR